MTDPPATAGAPAEPFAAIGLPSSLGAPPAAAGDGAAFDWRRRGRPVRWVAAAVVATTVCGLGAATTGAVAPQVQIQSTGSGHVAPSVGFVSVVVANQAVADTHLTAAGASSPGLELTGVTTGVYEPRPQQLVAEAGSALPDGGVAVPRGTDLEVVLRYEVRDCERAGAQAASVPLRFRTPLGLTRTVDAAGSTAPNPVAEMVRTVCGAGPAG